MLIIKNDRVIFQGKYLRVWETEFIDKKSQRQTWEWIERKNAIFTFPITPEQNIVLIKNFRIPLKSYVIEMPAGLKDKEGESDEEVALRELLEETGYSCQKLLPINSWPYRSGSSNGISKGFIATGLIKLGDCIVGDDTEDIIVFEIKMDELLDFYMNLPDNLLFDLGILAMHNIAKHLGIRG